MRLHVHEFANDRALCVIRTAQGRQEHIHMPTVHMQNCLKSLLPFEGNTIHTNNSYKLHCTSSTPNEFEINLVCPLEGEENRGDIDHILSVYITPSGFEVLHAHHNTDNTDKELNYILHPSLTQCLYKVSAELLPLYPTCVKISSSIQKSCSESLLNMMNNKDLIDTNCGRFRRPISDQFLQDNATIISQLTDILNHHGDKHFSYKYSAKLLQLGGLFCAGAQAGKSTCFHVNELRNFEPSAKMLTIIRNQPPLKRGMTVVTKGETQGIRMYRHNLNVRVFKRDSSLTQCMNTESRLIFRMF